jgi:phosphoenolpyruvate-protein kinase (PTS system EI component)
MIGLFRAGIPTLLISRVQAEALRAGEAALLDGGLGWLGPPASAPPAPAEPRAPPPGLPVLTADGIPVRLRASVANPAGAALAVAKGAEAIGLVRSEFLVPDSGAPPDAGFYEQALAALCQAAAPLPVTIRLIDLAGDKRPPWFPNSAGGLSALGLQGSRLYDREPVRSVVLAEMDAIARLAPRFPLALIVPFVVGRADFTRWRDELGVRLPLPLTLGAMAETPAAVLALPELLTAADFVAIGCNDLAQCLFAADRDLPDVAEYLDPYAPAVFRLLRLAANAARGDIERLMLCGLLPQLPGVLPALVGLGYRCFSIEPLMIPGLAACLRGLRTTEADELATRVCAAGDGAEVRRLLGLPADAWR